jgi:DNA recombination protein RmuC
MNELLPALMDIARRELGSARDEINKDVVKEKGMIKETLEKFESAIREKQEELKKFEIERNKQFGTITESINIHREIVGRLGEKTDNLSKILNNNKLRGAFGERVAEDLLHHAGFIEGVHYEKQKAVRGGTIPDFTLLLPNNRVIHIDAKFPLANAQNYQDSEDENERREYLKSFSQDVKQKIREITSRKYINSDENTLDFAIIFVPSDAVYSFLNTYAKDAVDDGFAHNVLITSPSSFYATARIIMEAHRHFSYEKNIREILEILQQFIENFQRFKNEFSSFGDSIDNLKDAYKMITETRYNKMSAQMKKIERFEQVRASAIGARSED